MKRHPEATICDRLKGSNLELCVRELVRNQPLLDHAAHAKGRERQGAFKHMMRIVGALKTVIHDLRAMEQHPFKLKGQFVFPG